MMFEIEITPEILSLIAEIDEFKGRWQELRNISPDQLQNLHKIATIESVGSSTRIEGATLSNREVEEILSKVEHYSFRSRDEEEVAGYAKTMETIFASWSEITLTENHIKQLHASLLEYSSKDEKHRGEYKKFPNHVEAFDQNGESLGIIFKTATPFETPLLMSNLITSTRAAQDDKTHHPLLVIAIFIVKLLAIHPFQDGNGRLSRIITTLLMLQAGYDYVPYISMENIIETNKDGYYLALRRTQTTLNQKTPDWHHWVLFFLRTLKQQKNKLLQKIAREKILSQELSELSQKIIQTVQDRGRITTSEAEKLTGAAKGTIKLHLRKLVENGYLALHGKGRGSWYTLK